MSISINSTRCFGSINLIARIPAPSLVWQITPETGDNIPLIIAACSRFFNPIEEE
jgi:hypothetical protein